MNYREVMNEVRTSHDVSQKQMADILNISAYTYSHYETQDHIIPLKHLNIFCNYFNVSFDFIFGLNSKEHYDKSRPDIDLVESGLRIKDYRKEVNLTQLELAKELNVARTAITEYEKGHYLISTHSLYSICKKYKVSADYLLAKIDKPRHIRF